MRKTVLFVALCLAGWSASAQSPGSALSIDANANRHAISSYIYGINFYWTLPASTDPAFPAALAAAQGIRATARRRGGNNTSTYHQIGRYRGKFRDRTQTPAKQGLRRPVFLSHYGVHEMVEYPSPSANSGQTGIRLPSKPAVTCLCPPKPG